MDGLDHNGERWQVFIVTYCHDGRQYSFEFYAKSATEAEARIDSMRKTAHYAGRILDTHESTNPT